MHRVILSFRVIDPFCLPLWEDLNILCEGALSNKNSMRCNAGKRVIAVAGLWVLMSAPEHAARAQLKASFASTQDQPLSPAKTYRGSIGDLPIEMRLKTVGREVSGTYSYDRVGKDLKLQGVIGAQAGLELEEFDADGRKTGKFACKRANVAVDWDLECNWTKPNGRSQTYVALSEQHISFTNGLRIAPKVIIDRKRRADISYPLLTGDGGSLTAAVTAFNRLINSLVAASLKEYEPLPGDSFSANYNVLLATNQIVSVEVNEYFSGGAHPASHYWTVTYDLAANRELHLADLFKTTANYEGLLKQHSLNFINKRAEQIARADASRTGNQEPSSDLNLSIDDLAKISAWAMTPNGLLVYFDFPHVIAVLDRAFVPYGTMRDHLKPDGPVTRSSGRAP